VFAEYAPPELDPPDPTLAHAVEFADSKVFRSVLNRMYPGVVEGLCAVLPTGTVSALIINCGAVLAKFLVLLILCYVSS
jgi:phage shock protein PspC (stress-responsive transcriptional regulator)